MLRSMVLLPADFATICRASRIGTPEESIVPRVRVKRATATLRTSEPKSGTLSVNASHRTRLLGFETKSLNATTNAIGMPMKRYQFSVSPCERLMKNWVGADIAPPKSLNIFSNVGVTKMFKDFGGAMPAPTQFLIN